MPPRGEAAITHAYRAAPLYESEFLENSGTGTDLPELSAVATFVVLLTRRHLKCILALSVRTLAWSNSLHAVLCNRGLNHSLPSQWDCLTPYPNSYLSKSITIIGRPKNQNRLQQDIPARFLLLLLLRRGQRCVRGGGNKRGLFCVHSDTVPFLWCDAHFLLSSLEEGSSCTEIREATLSAQLSERREDTYASTSMDAYRAG